MSNAFRDWQMMLVVLGRSMFYSVTSNNYLRLIQAMFVCFSAIKKAIEDVIRVEFAASTNRRLRLWSMLSSLFSDNVYCIVIFRL